MRTKIISSILFLFIITTTTKAQEWEFVGLDSLLIKQLYVSGDTIWAATDARINTNMIAGVYKTNDGGTNWHQLDSTLGDGTSVYFYKNSNNNLYYLVKGNGSFNIAGTLYKSLDEGQSWEILQQLKNISIDWIGFSPFNKNEIYARESHYIPAGWYETVYRSLDGGSNWQEITYLPASSHGRNLTFNISLTDSNKLYAAVDDKLGGKYFYVSTNKGDSWNYISEPPSVPAELINDSELSERIYMSSLYISENGGYSWELADLGIPDTSYYLSFYESPFNTNEIFTLRSDGLYKSEKENIYWEKIGGSENLPLNIGGGYWFIYEDVGELRNVFADTSENVIYVGTTKGIYKKNLITDVNEILTFQPYNYILFQNYPNPFNPTTTISYQIPEKSFIIIKVYDVLGNEIRTLVAEYKQKGIYQIEFNGSELTSGVYFYVLTANSGNSKTLKQGRKMLLIK